MKIKLFSFIISLITVFSFAQSLIIGQTTDEDGRPASQIYIVNLQTGKETYSGSDGKFLISAEVGEQLRFVSQSYERVDKKVSAEDFARNVKIQLLPRYIQIQEVKLGFAPTGNLKYDLKNLPRNLRNEEVNYKIERAIAMGKPKDMPPVLKTPSMFQSQTKILAGTLFSIDLSSKKSKERAEAEKPLKMSQYSGVIYAVLGDPFFEEIKIPKSKIRDFITWTLIHQPIPETVISRLKHRDWATVRMWLEDAAEEFRSAS